MPECCGIGPCGKCTIDDWHAVVDTNLDGVFYCCKYSLDVIRDAGRIVNIASIAGIFPFHGQTNYAAAKAGVIAITKVLSRELARRGITANAIAPGIIQTTMIGDLKPEVLAEYEKQIPLGRSGVRKMWQMSCCFWRAKKRATSLGK